MLKKQIDAYFHLASHGDNEAYKLLYKEFVGRANYVIKQTVKNNSQFRGFSGDFSDLIDELFFEAINGFEPEKKTFSAYVDYLFAHRLVGAVKSEIHCIQNYIADIDFEDESIKSIEMLSDPVQPSVQNEIALMNFEATIASPNRHKTKERRLRDKVLTLQYAGYKTKEICDALGLTYSQLRRILNLIKEDDEIINLKLDLK